MTQNKLEIMLDCSPKSVAISMSVDDEVSGTAKEVREEIAKHIDSGFSSGEWGEVHAIHFECHSFGA